MPKHIASHPAFSAKLEPLIADYGARAPDCAARCRLEAIQSLMFVAAKQVRETIRQTPADTLGHEHRWASHALRGWRLGEAEMTIAAINADPALAAHFDMQPFRRVNVDGLCSLIRSAQMQLPDQEMRVLRRQMVTRKLVFFVRRSCGGGAGVGRASPASTSPTARRVIPWSLLPRPFQDHWSQ
eukprot:869146-Pyramimonas_sp.AAC.1